MVIVGNYYCFNVYFVQLGEVFFNIVFDDIFQCNNVQYMRIFYYYQWCGFLMCNLIDFLINIGREVIIVSFNMVMNGIDRIFMDYVVVDVDFVYLVLCSKWYKGGME